MPETGSKLRIPMLLLPVSLLDYDFGFNTTKTEMIYFTFVLLKHDEQLRADYTLRDDVLKETLGTRWKEYVQAILDSGIQPFDEKVWEHCKPYWFKSAVLQKHIDRILEYL